SLKQDTLDSVDADRQVVHTTSGHELRYDALMLAVGARALEAPAGIVTLNDRGLTHALPAAIEDIKNGLVHSVAFVVPSSAAWSQPAYEVALLTRQYAREQDRTVDVTIITAEPGPMA